jgi:hypothetical protein
MKRERIQNPSRSHSNQQPTRPMARISWFRVAASILFMGALLAAALHSQQPGQQSAPQPSSTTNPQDPGPGRAWSTSTLEVPMPSGGNPDFTAANAERKKQIADDSIKLLKLATDLKSEVDKTTKDTLSLNVIRKADEIEKLAHDVKEKMKLTAATH